MHRAQIPWWLRQQRIRLQGSRPQVRPLGWEDPLEKGMATHSSIRAGEFHGQRSLADYRPWGRKESDTTEQLQLVTAQIHCF